VFQAVDKMEKLWSQVSAARHRATRELPPFRFQEGDPQGAQAPGFDHSHWSHLRLGDHWGGYDVVAWFRTRVLIPAEWRAHKLALRLQMGPRDGFKSTAEALLYAEGKPLQGIDIWHDEAWLPPELTEGGELNIAIRAWSGVYGPPPRRRLAAAELVWIDAPSERLAGLTAPLLETLRVLDANDSRRLRVLAVLEQVFASIDFTRPRSERYYASVAGALAELLARLPALGEGEGEKPKVIGVGHSHIDMAWLWQLKHTVEKSTRTFSTALHLMRQYPDYRFLHSSPQLYKLLEAQQPELFERVRERIAEGRWEISGAMWIEPDCNVTSGESLVRQLLLGTRYTQRTFGVRTRILWLPDVFGFNAALPQLMKSAGLTTLITSKLSWNQANRFPHDTFRWRGLDGTEVLAHFMTTPEEGSPNHHTYNGTLRANEVKGTWDNYQQKQLNDELMTSYGWGDGGGGPTREMLEGAPALANLPGMPRLELGSAEGFAERLHERVAHAPLPVWDGELYLEYHRGTYTSQAHIKRANRKAEILYHDAELLSSVADVVTGGRDYPWEALQQGWELILLNQFHDILPGSSIAAVYEDTRRDHQRATELGQRALDDAFSRIAEATGLATPSVLVFNSLGFPRADVLELPLSGGNAVQGLLGADGKALPVQQVERGGEMRLLVELPEVPAMGYAAFAITSASAPRASSPQASERSLENGFYRLRFDAHGQLESLLDKRVGREVLAPGSRGNVLQTFQDRPVNFDAWDIDAYYEDSLCEVRELVDVRVVEQGPIRAALQLTWRFHESVIKQRVVLHERSPRIDFETEIDWHQSQILLKVAFPVAVRATRATYEIPFGNLERPTHRNTSWDAARFEVPAHRWVDLSQADYGVALLNDCKYGHDVHDHVMRLTLLRSPIDPDPDADQGKHHFTYSLLPHVGDWRQGGVMEEAHALNFPLHARSAPPRTQVRAPATFSFARSECPHVVLDTVKKAEDEDAWILRVYEFQQAGSDAAALRFGRPLRRAVECNVLEEGDLPVRIDGDRIVFGIAPYQLKTFKVWFE